MLEDLRNYRTLGENPETTMALPGRGAAAPAGFLRPPLAATQVLPGPVRTSHVNPPLEQRKRTGLWVLVSLLLLASIGYCGYQRRSGLRCFTRKTSALQGWGTRGEPRGGVCQSAC